MTAPTADPGRERRRLVTMLATVLEAERRGHATVADLLEQQQASVRTARGEELAERTDRLRIEIDALLVLQKQREGLAGRLRALVGTAPERPTLRALLPVLEAGERATLEPLVETVRAAAADVTRRSAVLREAADSLHRHVDGLVRSALVEARPGAAYGPRGVLGPPPMSTRHVDLRP